jgi:riboflavin synthase
MFAGIVSAVGRIVSAEPHGDGLRLRIQAEELGLDDVKVGDSIALAGACHTVVARSGVAFDVDTSRATIAVTTGLAAGREVNLEKSLRLADRIDGHLVAGHVDGVGTVTGFEELGGSVRLEVQAPAELARYIARKGSITVDGVSLTVNKVEGARFEVNVIPHPRAVTTLGGLALGARVNLEVDMLARYVERLVSFDREGK